MFGRDSGSGTEAKTDIEQMKIMQALLDYLLKVQLKAVSQELEVNWRFQEALTSGAGGVVEGKSGASD